MAARGEPGCLVKGLIALCALALLLTAPAAAQAADFAYVTEELSNEISVIDIATNTASSTIPVGNTPQSIAVTPDNKRAYVTHFQPDNVSVIDTAANAVVATVPVAIDPSDVAITPDGTRAYVTNRGSDSVSVIATATNTVIATITVGDAPNDIAITPDGTRAYVSNDLAGTVSVIDTAINTVSATIAVGTSPDDIAIAPAGNWAYVAMRGQDSVNVIDTATNTVIATIAVGNNPTGVAITPNGTRAYVANRFSDNVSVIDTATNTVNGAIAVGATPGELAITPNGTRAYVANRFSDNVSVIDTATNTVNATIALGSFSSPHDVAIVSATATPTLTTEASPHITIGGEITDTATLAGGDAPTGTITFDVYGPDDGDCSQPAVFTDEIDVNGNGDYTSDPFSPTETGTYRWIASYSGDANNEAVTTACNDPNESVTVNKATPTITTQASPDVAVGAGQISDTATLAGGFQPSGTITFTLFGPDDGDCSQPAVFTDEIDVNGNGDYTSDPFSPTATGTYRWIASYSGDGANHSVASACNDPGESVNVIHAATTLEAHPAILEANPTLMAGLNLTGTVRLSVSATLTDPQGDGIVGEKISFSAGEAKICTATTNASGDAACRGPAPLLSAVLGLGYEASYAGSDAYTPSSDEGTLIRIGPKRGGIEIF